MSSMKWLRSVALGAAFLFPVSVSAEVPWQFADNTRYMAMGDSLAAGYGAIPATQGICIFALQRRRVRQDSQHTPEQRWLDWGDKPGCAGKAGPLSD